MKLQQILVYISFFLFSGVCIHAQLIDLEGKIIAENEETAFVNIINLKYLDLFRPLLVDS